MTHPVTEISAYMDFPRKDIVTITATIIITITVTTIMIIMRMARMRIASVRELCATRAAARCRDGTAVKVSGHYLHHHHHYLHHHRHHLHHHHRYQTT